MCDRVAERGAVRCMLPPRASRLPDHQEGTEMDAALARMPIIDVDTHFTEPPELWTSRAPAKLRDRAPRVERDAHGVEQWVVDRNLVLGPVGYCVIRRDGSKANGRVSLDTFAEVHA